jgi:hypothetical protein
MPDAQQLGYRLAIHPGLILRAVMQGADQALRTLKETQLPPPAPKRATVADTFRRFGADDWDRLRRQSSTDVGDLAKTDPSAIRATGTVGS